MADREELQQQAAHYSQEMIALQKQLVETTAIIDQHNCLKSEEGSLENNNHKAKNILSKKTRTRPTDEEVLMMHEACEEEFERRKRQVSAVKAFFMLEY